MTPYQRRLGLVLGAIALTVIALSSWVFISIPFAFATNVTTAPSSPCVFPPSSTNANPTLQIHVPLIAIGNISFSTVVMNNRTSTDFINDNSSQHYHWVTHKHGTDNETTIVNLQGIHIVHANGSLAYGRVDYWFNGTRDSYALVKGFSVTTTNVNATTRKISIFAQHFEGLMGSRFANKYSSPHSYPDLTAIQGAAISLDNFHFSILYNCANGKTSVSTFGSIPASTIGNIASSIVRSKIGI